MLPNINANDTELVSSLLKQTTQALTKKENPKIFLYDKKKLSLELDNNLLNIVQKCEEADIVLLSSVDDLPRKCMKKILLSTYIPSLQQNNILGALFWHKGRPNIILYEKKLKQKHIKLDSSFNKYIE